MRHIKQKIIKSGNIIEVYDYENGYYTDYECKGKGARLGRSVRANTDKQKANREQAVYKARRELRRIINSNFNRYYDSKGKPISTKFLTLTFEDNITDEKYANAELEKFIKKLNYKAFNTKKAELKYTTVVARQSRGALHYHILLYNVPYISNADLKALWQHGYLKINRVNHLQNVGTYVAKHIKVDSGIEGKHYFNSKNLYKSDEITDPNIVKNILSNLSEQEPMFESENENDYLGKITYKQFSIKKD